MFAEMNKNNKHRPNRMNVALLKEKSKEKKNSLKI
jgi:hypothetical protein